MSYEAWSKEDMEAELRRRGFQVPESRNESNARLEEDDAQRNGDNGNRSGGTDRAAGESREAGGEPKRRPAEIVRSAARQLQELSGRPLDGIAGFERTDEGWRVLLDLVEVSRVPPSTDVLGTYEVTVDQHGDLLGYSRIRRYVRSESGRDNE